MTDASFLLEYPIYREFDAEDIDTLSKICQDKKYAAKETIFMEGDPGDAMYIIKNGVVKIFKETKNRRKFIALTSAGEFFGEMALIDGSPRSATVIADADTDLLMISTVNFKKLKTEYAKTGFKLVDVLLKYMSYRIRRTTKKAASLLKGRKKKKTKSK